MGPLWAPTPRAAAYQRKSPGLLHISSNQCARRLSAARSGSTRMTNARFLPGHDFVDAAARNVRGQGLHLRCRTSSLRTNRDDSGCPSHWLMFAKSSDFNRSRPMLTSGKQQTLAACPSPDLRERYLPTARKLSATLYVQQRPGTVGVFPDHFQLNLVRNSVLVRIRTDGCGLRSMSDPVVQQTGSSQA